MKHPIVIGVTGGIGAGKSTAIKMFKDRGAASFSADKAVHQLYATSAVVEAVRDRWGAGVVNDNGTVNRPAIAEIVFRDNDERAWLEAFIHPLVGEAWQTFVDNQNARSQPPEFIVAEVPLLFEAGLEDRYDAIVAITAPLETRLERVGSRASSRTLGAERAAVQLPDSEKIARADFAFDNVGERDKLADFVEQVMQDLQAQVVRA